MTETIIKKECVKRAIERFGIKCSMCKRFWLVGDKERGKVEKEKWICPDCKKASATDGKAEEIMEETTTLEEKAEGLEKLGDDKHFKKRD